MQENLNENYEGFVIDSPSKANWAIKQIKDARQRSDIFVSVAKDEISVLEEKIAKSKSDTDSQTSFLICALDNYLDELPAKSTKTQKTFDLPDGKLVRKFEKIDFVKTDELTSWLKENAPNFLKVQEPVPNWVELKKELIVSDEGLILTKNGEIVEGVILETKPASFDIK